MATFWLEFETLIQGNLIRASLHEIRSYSLVSFENALQSVTE